MDATSPKPDEFQVPKSKRRFDQRKLLLGAFAGMAIGIAVCLTLVFVMLRDPLPTLTESIVDTAEQKWNDSGPDSYNLDLELSGNRPGRVHVEVRRGEVTLMSRDGNVPSQKRTWDAWSVPGQFDTIHREFELAADPSGTLGDASATTMYIRGEFDPQYGFPQRYHRLVLGTNNEIGWKIVHFEVVP